MSNTDTDFINLDENPVYANQISEFIQCLNLSCLRFQRPQLYVIIIFVPVLFVHRLYHRDNKKTTTVNVRFFENLERTEICQSFI
jgi:hypothetical protein